MLKRFLFIPLSVLGLLLFITCSGNDDMNTPSIVGTWELVKIQDSQSGDSLPPNDNKPVLITFKNDSSYDGVAGNNSIEGNYVVEADRIIFDLSSTEVANTMWESMFKIAIDKSLSNGQYNMIFYFNFNEMVMTYGQESNLFFTKI